MKRCARLATLVVAALVLLLGFDWSASARPVAYPVTGGCATVLVSSTEVPQGGHLGISGTGFTPGAQLTIEFHSTVVILGHVTADASGAFSTTVTIPADAEGNHTITVTGGGDVCPIDPIQVTVHGTGGKHTHRPPSITGVAIASMLILAACLLLVGYFVNASASKRRKKRNKQHHAEPRHAAA